MSARVVAIMLACCFASFVFGVIFTAFAEPWEQRIRSWWRGRDLRRHRGDFWQWERDPTKEVDHE